MSPTNPTHSHSRTGSSPAMMQASPPGVAPQINQQQVNAAGTKAARTHTYPKLPDKFKVRNEQQPPPEEEVIYF